MQDGIEGQCKTNYEYRRLAYDLRNKQNKNAKYISISKVRDLTDCKVKPWFASMLFIPQKCDTSVSVPRHPILEPSL